MRPPIVLVSTDKPHRLRSWLFTPATKPDRFAKAAAVGADALIIDLEDAVAPADKDSARRTALEYLSGAASPRPARILRINAIETGAGINDLAALLQGPVDPDFIVVPKVDAAAHLHILDKLLTTGGKKARLVALIETARALSSIDSIATATPRLGSLMFGAADMAADLGAVTGWGPLLGARSRIVAAAALAQLPVIDSPFFDFKDADGLARETAEAIALGFTGKAAIHPDQVATINQALTPSAEAVSHAHAVMEQNKKGVGVIDGQMIDEAVARKARRTLAAAGETA